MVQISVIIPVYNSEKYLAKCIESMLNQTFTDFELILINDGSIDGSYDICKRYAQIDNRIILLTQENKGVSAARNAAISIAKGKYFAFVDSDDYVKSDYLEVLYDAINKPNIGLGVCGYCNVNKILGEKRVAFLKHKSRHIRKQILYCDLFCNGYLMGFLWNKIFIADIIRKHNLLMNEKLKICEDQEFCYRYFNYIEEAYCCDRICYYYVKHTESATSFKKDVDYAKKQEVFTKEMLNALCVIQNFKCEYQKQNIKYIQMAKVGIMCNCIVECVRENVLPKEYKEYQTFIRKSLLNSIKWKGFKFNRKILTIAIAIHWRVVWILCIILDQYKKIRYSKKLIKQES